MNRTFLAAALCMATTAPALSEAYMMGTGRWTCERARAAFVTQNVTDQAQVAGWILGYWSHASIDKPTAFLDKMQEVGGTKIVEITLAECQKNPNAMLFQVTEAILQNSLNEQDESGAASE
ncbi:HdeA/HdeB family chaperone [Vannielia litorea]|uniref:HdeA/HdeB family chaperone n=1 Tax=Vannielia TaxID=2813041 RepID=UPI001C970785|nr:HdeA/HdeB family chaperone [Vannielia litorea]MBY6048129.1 HdeA family protein [Vannielia litorea]MBY6075543.1 HdeA family protein [Vannielia litorea]